MQVILKDLYKKFAGSVVAVDHLDLDIADGEFAVLLGPSGCGKTTTMRMIAGLERPDSGDIYIGDTNVVHLPPKDRHVAMVFQNFALYLNMNIYENIAFPLEVRKMPRAEIEKRVTDVARMVGVEGLLKRRPRQVSGGEAQRVALARAMVRDPQVFLMDEPLSNLDAKLRVQLRTEIKRLHQENRVTTIYVTHDQEEALTLGDKIVVMNRGQVQQMGTPDEVFHHPLNTFVATFVGSPSMNLLDGTICSGVEGRPVVDLAAFSQPVPDRFLDALRTKGVERVKWGIRPEAIKLPDESQIDDVAGRVDVIEPLGSRQLIFMRIGDQVFVVMTDAERRFKAGETRSLRFEGKNVHMFDAQTGLSLSVA